MKQNLITDVIQGMLPYLNNAQTERLQEVLQHTLFDYEVTKTEKDKELSEQNLVSSFLSAKDVYKRQLYCLCGSLASEEYG